LFYRQQEICEKLDFTEGNEDFEQNFDEPSGGKEKVLTEVY